MNPVMVSSRDAEKAETAEGLRLRRGRFQTSPTVKISRSASVMSFRLGKMSLRPLLSLRLCAKQKFGVAP
jgi:hypothetical protein